MVYSPPPRRRGKPDHAEIDRMISLKIDNLSSRTSEQDLIDAFSPYGKVGDVFIPLSKTDRKSRGFGFVRFYHSRHSERSLRKLDNTRLNNKRMHISKAKSRRQYNVDSRHGGRLNGRSYSPRKRSYSREKRYNKSRSPVSSSSSESGSDRSASCESSRSRSRTSSRSASEEKSDNVSRKSEPVSD
ncbi:MAG: Serine arginine-rich splicing factor 2 [Paramarteilia canceri]